MPERSRQGWKVNNQPDLVASINGIDGTVDIWYWGAIGLRGGRYRLTTRQRTDGKSASVTASLADLVILTRYLADEVERARTGAARQ